MESVHRFRSLIRGVQSDGQRDQAREALKSLELEVTAAVWKAYYDFFSARKKYDASQALVAASEDSYTANLEAIVVTEHAYLQVELLAALTDEPRLAEIKQVHSDNLRLALKALDPAYAEKCENVLSGLDAGGGSSEWLQDLQVAIERTIEASNHTTPVSDEMTNVLGFVGGLEELGGLLERRERPSTPIDAEPAGAETDSAHRPFFDPAAFRFSVKLGAAMTLGLPIGLTTQRVDLQTILWSIAVSAWTDQQRVQPAVAFLGYRARRSDHWRDLSDYVAGICQRQGHRCAR